MTEKDNILRRYQTGLLLASNCSKNYQNCSELYDSNDIVLHTLQLYIRPRRSSIRCPGSEVLPNFHRVWPQKDAGLAHLHVTAQQSWKSDEPCGTLVSTIPTTTLYETSQVVLDSAQNNIRCFPSTAQSRNLINIKLRSDSLFTQQSTHSLMDEEKF